MLSYIALLRGINVGGHNKIKMADLRELCLSLGFTDVKTLLQSGNVVFESTEDNPLAVQKILEQGIQDHFGFTVNVILHTPQSLRAIVASHPFTAPQLADPAKLAFVYLATAPHDDALTMLQQKHTGDEIITVADDVLYIVYPNGMGRSKLTNKWIETILKVPTTMRNWNTTMKLVGMV